MKKRILSTILTLCMMVSLLPVNVLDVSAEDFSDMPTKEHWSYNALLSAIKNGLLNGANGCLMPGKALSRAEMAAIMNRAFGANEQADISGFADVKGTAWYAADIAKAVRMGIFKGSGNGIMRPGDPVTRQEAFVVLARAFKLANGDTNALAGFSDRKQVATWAAPALTSMISAGYVHGSSGKLNPASSISRADFAQVMYNMVSVYLSAGDTYTDAVDGNMVINAPGVTLKGATISGDLIIGEGVGNGDVTLNGVTVSGRLVVRGGGENSIHIINSSNVGSIVIGKTASGGVRIKAEEGCRVEVVYVDDGIDEVILEGVYNTVAVASDTPVKLKDAEVTTLSVNSGSADVSVTGTSTVTMTKIAEAAAGATVTVGAGSRIAMVESAATGVTIQGEGTVTEAIISGDNTNVNTKDTNVTVSQGTAGVSENGNSVIPGGGSTSSGPSTGGGTGMGGGSGTGGGSGDDDDDDDSNTGYTATVYNANDFVAAANNSLVKTIVVADEFTVDTDVSLTKPVIINNGAALGIGAATFNLYNTITNNGIIATVSEPDDGVEGWLRLYQAGDGSGNIGRVTNNGTFINNGHIELNALTYVDNKGTFSNAGNVHYVDFVGLNEQDPGKNAKYEAVRIPNITDNGGKIENIAVAFGINALQSALAQNVSGGDTAYYNVVSAIGMNKEGTATFTATENLTVRAGQQLYIEKGVTLVIPSGMSLAIAEDGEMHILGTLTVTGTATNNGFYIKESTGVINGVITDQGSGYHFMAYQVADNTAWASALADNKCCLVEVTGKVTVASDTNTNFNITINEGAALTIEEGSTLTLKAFYDGIREESLIMLNGAMINNGSLVIEPNVGIIVENGGALTNSGVIDAYGWINVDYESLGGTVNFYANLTDVARVLWKRLDGLLPQNVDESIDYDTYSEALAGLSNDDTEGRYALTWLFKNGVLSTEGFVPYNYADGSKIGALLEAFAAAAGKSYTASISGGVLTSDHIEGYGNSLDKLIDSFVNEIDVSSINVSSETELRNAQKFNFVEVIHVVSDISLTDSFTVTKNVVVDSGATLTVAGNKNLTVDWQEWTEEQEGCNGILTIDGALVVPGGSFVINKCEINLNGGIITNNGTFTNMNDEVDCKYSSNFWGKGGTITNNGIFVANGHMDLSDTAFTNSGIRFTNNSSFEITRGSITSTVPFHNAGHMIIGDEYYDNLLSDSKNTIVAIDFGDTLTDNSNWLDYTAKVYSADGLAAAQAVQNARIEALGSEPAKTGLEIYSRMNILADITLSGSITLSGWDVWVETDVWWDENTKEKVYKPYTLTIGSGADLTMASNTLHVCGELINEGMLTVGMEDSHATLQVWPTGSLINTSGTIIKENGIIYRMDEYKDDGSAELMASGIITGYSDIQNIAIVHEWAALYDAAVTKSSFYERIDIMGNDCDIELQSDLNISADMYIEWDDGIEVPEGKTLTLTGDHWINNSGDIWVYGRLNIGSSIEVSNSSYIQIDGTVSNDGIIYNYNNITLMKDGSIEGSGTVINMPHCVFMGDMGTVYCAVYRMVENEEQLINALSIGDPILVAGDVTLTQDLTLTEDVTVGMPNFRNGNFRTGGNTVTVDSGKTLAVVEGELEIGENGDLVNDGTLTFGTRSGLRILSGGTLTTASDVYINGRMDLYDWENQSTYLLGTGKVYSFANECDLIHRLYHCLYVTDENGAPVGLESGITGVTPITDFDTDTELASIGTGLTGWEEINRGDNPDIYSQYAYAALSLNGIIGDTINPYSKLAYENAKAIMTAVAERLAVDISGYLGGMPDSTDYICNNNASESGGSDFDELCNAFQDALSKALLAP